MFATIRTVSASEVETVLRGLPVGAGRPPIFLGAPRWIRTINLPLRGRSLVPLSYRRLVPPCGVEPQSAGNEPDALNRYATRACSHSPQLLPEVSRTPLQAREVPLVSRKLDVSLLSTSTSPAMRVNDVVTLNSCRISCHPLRVTSDSRLLRDGPGATRSSVLYVKVRAGFPAKDRLVERAFTCMRNQPALRRETRRGASRCPCELCGPRFGRRGSRLSS